MNPSKVEFLRTITKFRFFAHSVFRCSLIHTNREGYVTESLVSIRASSSGQLWSFCNDENALQNSISLESISRKGHVANPECHSSGWEAGTSALRSSWCTKMCLNNGSVKFCMGCPSTARDCVTTLNEEPITPCLWKKKKLSDNLRSGLIWAVLIHSL